MTSFPLLAGGALLLAAIIAAPAAATPLSGTWAGEHLNLTIGADGATLESDCASGSIKGPLTPDAKGKFHATGQFEQYHPGPQRVEEGETPVNTTKFAGIVHGDTLALTVTAPGTAPQHYTLKRGKLAKLVRCY
jgi:hypothetical protein